MNKSYYSSVEDVKNTTGIKHTDLRLEKEEDLDRLIERWLYQIKDLINTNRNRDFSENNEYYINGNVKVCNVPEGIHNIALRMACNMVAQALARRSSPVMMINDNVIDIMSSKIMTNDIKEDLKMYKPVSFPFFK